MKAVAAAGIGIAGPDVLVVTGILLGGPCYCSAKPNGLVLSRI